MNESHESGKSVDKHLEGAINSNAEFLAALDEVENLEQLKHLIHEFATVQDGESIVFEIIEKPGEEVDAVTFSEEELIQAINLFNDGTPVEQSEILGLMPHTQIAAVLSRILLKE